MFSGLITFTTAHKGGIDALGCHHDRKNNGYHCYSGPLKGQTFNTKDEARMRMIAPPAPKPQGITGKARIIDGDTIEIAGQRIKLFGIDVHC